MTDSPFVETSVSRDIFSTIEMAHELKKNAAIVGRPGVGKTRALKAYTEVHENYFMTATAVSGNALRDLLRELADMIGINASGYTISGLQRRMFEFDLIGHILIIDEAQNLKLQAFRELLHLHDFTGLCLIFCGNDEVLKRVKTDKGAFAQISRRVPIRAEVNRILDEDADRLAAAFGVEGADAHKMLRALGAQFHTDGVVSVLEIARRFAGGKPVKGEHVRRACDLLPLHRTALRSFN